MCVRVFQGHRHLRRCVRRGLPDGGGGGPVPVRVHVLEERARLAGRRVQRHQHRDPGRSRWVKGRRSAKPFRGFTDPWNPWSTGLEEGLRRGRSISKLDSGPFK